MIEKLQKKIFILLSVILTATLLAVLTAVNISSYQIDREQAVRYLEIVAQPKGGKQGEKAPQENC